MDVVPNLLQQVERTNDGTNCTALGNGLGKSSIDVMDMNHTVPGSMWLL